MKYLVVIAVGDTTQQLEFFSSVGIDSVIEGFLTFFLTSGETVHLNSSKILQITEVHNVT